MEILDLLIEFFGIGSVSEFTTFGEFLPWFCKLLLAVFLIAFIFKCLFQATWRIDRR